MGLINSPFLAHAEFPQGLVGGGGSEVKSPSGALWSDDTPSPFTTLGSNC